MKEKIDLAKIKADELDVVDLGNAAVETRQIAPAPFVQDNQFGWGEFGR